MRTGAGVWALTSPSQSLPHYLLDHSSRNPKHLAIAVTTFWRAHATAGLFSLVYAFTLAATDGWLDNHTLIFFFIAALFSRSSL
jgi:hypothetical protein